MIEIENNVLYWNGLRLCYAAHQISQPIDGDCYLSFSHRHGRTLISVDGKAWLGDNDGSLPYPDIVIGSVVGINGLLPDPNTMDHLLERIQSREDDGLSTRIKVS